MATRLYVGGVSYDTTDESLREFFEQIGPVAMAQVIRDRESGRSKGFGFVEMDQEGQAAQAIHDLNGAELDGRRIRVDRARPREATATASRGNGRTNFNSQRSRDY